MRLTGTLTPNYRQCSPSRVKRYRGFRAPRCQGGHGCGACMTKYRDVKSRGLGVVA